jgi:hypothetical protein
VRSSCFYGRSLITVGDLSTPLLRVIIHREIGSL